MRDNHDEEACGVKFEYYDGMDLVDLMILTRRHRSNYLRGTAIGEFRPSSCYGVRHTDNVSWNSECLLQELENSGQYQRDSKRVGKYSCYLSVDAEISSNDKVLV